MNFILINPFMSSLWFSEYVKIIPQTNINRLVFVMGNRCGLCGVRIRLLNVLRTLTIYFKVLNGSAD